jgi:NAD-dependent deacetylase
MAAALAASEDCDVLLTVGSTLSVYPAANCVPRARAAGARVVIVNGEATEMDHLAEVVLVASLSAVLPAICAA